MRKWSAILTVAAGLVLLPASAASASRLRIRLQSFTGTHSQSMVVFHLHRLSGCSPVWGRLRVGGWHLPLPKATLKRAVRRRVFRVHQMFDVDLSRSDVALDIACFRKRRPASSPQPPSAVQASAGGSGNLVFNGTFDNGLSNYSSQNGSCFSTIDSLQERFNITSRCDPGQDGHYRSDLNTKNIYPADVPECTSVPIDFPRQVEGVTDNTWLMFAETEDPFNPNQNDQAGWGMYLNSYYNGNDTSDPNQFAIAFADYNGFAPAWTSSSNVDTGWHTLSLCTNDANDSSGVVYGIWLDGVRQTFNHGPQSGSQTLSGFPIIQNDPGNSKNWPLIIDDYTGGSPTNELIHGAPLVAKMGTDGQPPEPSGGWTSP